MASTHPQTDIIPQHVIDLPLQPSPTEPKNPKKEAMDSKDPKGSALLPEMIGDYILYHTLGQGTFGKVKFGIHVPTQEKVAVKILEKSKIESEADVSAIKSEISILKTCIHPHISQLYQIIETDDFLYLILEYAGNGELFKLIVERNRLSEIEACQVFGQLLSALEYLHEQNICHRDLKPENILFDEYFDLKLVDFGLGKTFTKGELLNTCCGSPSYASPETISSKPYNGQLVDLWSSGVILYAMVCGFLPFDDESQAVLFRKIIECDLRIPEELSTQVSFVIKGLLKKDPNQRISIKAIKESDFYRELNQNSLESTIGVAASHKQEIDELVLRQMEFIYNIPQEKVVDAVKQNEKNPLSATYYLLKKKNLRTQYEKYQNDILNTSTKQEQPKTKQSNNNTPTNNNSNNDNIKGDEQIIKIQVEGNVIPVNQQPQQQEEEEQRFFDSFSMSSSSNTTSNQKSEPSQKREGTITTTTTTTASKIDENFPTLKSEKIIQIFRGDSQNKCERPSSIQSKAVKQPEKLRSEFKQPSQEEQQQQQQPLLIEKILKRMRVTAMSKLSQSSDLKTGKRLSTPLLTKINLKKSESLDKTIPTKQQTVESRQNNMPLNNFAKDFIQRKKSLSQHSPMNMQDTTISTAIPGISNNNLISNQSFTLKSTPSFNTLPPPMKLSKMHQSEVKNSDPFDLYTPLSSSKSPLVDQSQQSKLSFPDVSPICNTPHLKQLTFVQLFVWWEIEKRSSSQNNKQDVGMKKSVEKCSQNSQSLSNISSIGCSWFVEKRLKRNANKQLVSASLDFSQNMNQREKRIGHTKQQQLNTLPNEIDRGLSSSTNILGQTKVLFSQTIQPKKEQNSLQKIKGILDKIKVIQYSQTPTSQVQQQSKANNNNNNMSWIENIRQTCPKKERATTIQSEPKMYTKSQTHLSLVSTPSANFLQMVEKQKGEIKQQQQQHVNLKQRQQLSESQENQKSKERLDPKKLEIKCIASSPNRLVLSRDLINSVGKQMLKDPSQIIKFSASKPSRDSKGLCYPRQDHGSFESKAKEASTGGDPTPKQTRPTYQPMRLIDNFLKKKIEPKKDELQQQHNYSHSFAQAVEKQQQQQQQQTSSASKSEKEDPLRVSSRDASSKMSREIVTSSCLFERSSRGSINAAISIFSQRSRNNRKISLNFSQVSNNKP